MEQSVQKILQRIRSDQPVVLNLTNNVTINFVANSLLALGAAPIMTSCSEEIEELVQLSQAVYLNIGTLDAPFIDLCLSAIQYAKIYKKPIILDPVGAGATRIRTETAMRFMRESSIIRGNASEIMALSASHHATKGVESVHSTTQAQKSAIELAKDLGCTIIVSGAIDLVTNGFETEHFNYGSPIMTRITGMGCAMTAIVAAFSAVESNMTHASQCATYYVGYCGWQASNQTQSPGSFQAIFLDFLHHSS